MLHVLQGWESEKIEDDRFRTLPTKLQSSHAIEALWVFPYVLQALSLPSSIRYSADPENWMDENSMLSGLASKAAQMNPSLVFVGGDMQNWWPNENSAESSRNRPKGMSDEDFAVLCSKELGRRQRTDVRQSLQVLERAGIPVCYTPGNHDIGDHPDVQTLDQYAHPGGDNPGWGPLFQRVKEKGGILYLQFNSQVYWSTNGILDQYREKQLEFLQNEMSKIHDNIRRLVLLTHIPPFMESVDETW